MSPDTVGSRSTRLAGGHAAAVLSTVLFGVSITLIRRTVQSVPPMTLAVIRFALGGLVLVLAERFVVSRRPIRITKREAPLLVGLGAIFFALYPAALNTSLRLATASQVSLIIGTTPVWGALLTRVFHRRPLSRVEGAAVALSVAGIAVTVLDQGPHASGDHGSELLGSGLALISAICAAGYAILLPRALATQSPLTVVAFAMTSGAVLLSPGAVGEILTGQSIQLDANVVLQLLFLGTIGGAAAFALRAFSLDRLPLIGALVYGNLNPVVAASAGIAFLGEPMSATLGIGFLCVLSGIVLSTWRRTTASRPPVVAER